MKVVWKVVTPNGTSPLTWGEAVVNYNYDVVKAPDPLAAIGNHLFAFDNRDDAMRFLRNIEPTVGSLKLIKCHGYGITKKMPFALRSYFFPHNAAQTDGDRLERKMLPEGTVLCRVIAKPGTPRSVVLSMLLRVRRLERRQRREEREIAEWASNYGRQGRVSQNLDESA